MKMTVIDGFDNCIIGIAEVDGVPRVVYSVEKVIASIIAGSDGTLSIEDAIEHISFNIEGSFPNLDHHPLLMREVTDREELDAIADAMDDDDEEVDEKAG